jgi:alkanesulfonate monooxygenase SsuD/methylene tetrahydromethanopterin reductase-like flavin-dependent oxidoreductase (luciferase family)
MSESGGYVRIGAILAPTRDWASITQAAKAADEAGLDAVGLWSHYHSGKPEWGYVAGWSAYGALAAHTTRVRLVPMVLNNLHYQVGVIAKESSMLALMSGDRFELAIGAGDWPDSYPAWGETFPDRDERIGRLVETVAALREVWTGAPVMTTGEYVRLAGATCTPPPAKAPRVVIGVAGSRRTAKAALTVADELNLYADQALLADVRQLIARSGRSIEISLFFDWSWDNWPAEPAAVLEPWRDLGLDRFFVSLGANNMPARVEALAALT